MWLYVNLVMIIKLAEVEDVQQLKVVDGWQQQQHVIT